MDLVVVGAGLFGLTVAREAAARGMRVLLQDSRDHVGGNAYSRIDEATGIEVHRYGAHLFHTSNERVWAWANRFTAFTPYSHRVFTTHAGQVYPLPINLATINQFYRAAYTPAQARELITREAAEVEGHPGNLREKGISLIGRPLYEAFVEGYTAKQWQTPAEKLPAAVITRLPVRYSYDSRYFNDRYEGLPVDGYSAWLERIADHPNITVRLGNDFLDPAGDVHGGNTAGRVPVVYSGPIDRYFDHRHGQLGWRTSRFVEDRLDVPDYQGCPVMNYADVDVPHTRVMEWRHLTPHREIAPDQTIITREFPGFAAPGDDPHYPINTAEDRARLALYRADAAREPGVIFGGRLGSYQYIDMHMAIASALSLADNHLA